jgi:hypothetical protein
MSDVQLDPSPAATRASNSELDPDSRSTREPTLAADTPTRAPAGTGIPNTNAEATTGGGLFDGFLSDDEPSTTATGGAGLTSPNSSPSTTGGGLLDSLFPDSESTSTSLSSVNGLRPSPTQTASGMSSDLDPTDEGGLAGVTSACSGDEVPGTCRKAVKDYTGYGIGAVRKSFVCY